MKLSLTLFSLSLAVHTAAQDGTRIKDAANGAAVPIPPKEKLLIPAMVNKLRAQQPHIESAAKLAARAPSPMASCRYSCPLRDMDGTPLAKKPSAFGWDFDGYFVDSVVGRAGKGKGETKGKGWYDVFECVYNLPTLESQEHTCSYYKHDGTHALGYKGDNCPSQAPACLHSSSSFPYAPPAVPILGLVANEDEESTASSTPHFSSSQLDGAELRDRVRGIYEYKDTMETPAWINEGRIYVHVKEHPPLTLD